jgi:TonB-linked SusC/RagA family outer membrane protein
MKKAKTFSNVSSFNKRFMLKQSLWISGALLFISNSTLANYPPSSSPNSKLEFAISATQQKIITGTVRDASSKAPLAGVTIKVLGKSAATSTNETGSFEISASVNDILEITYVGYQKAEIGISASTNTLAIELNQDISSLEDVVVTGYSTQRKMDLTGSVAIVDAAQLKSTPAASAVESLQGRATGVQIVADGAPGSTPQIKIRGFSTINNNEPLYVIDGVPFEGKLSWLNQNDIESMQVLKDASAASIYGSRANNGVVIITTKTGKVGKPQINVDSYYGIQVPKTSSFPKMLTPQQVLDFDNAINGTNETLPDYLLAGGISGHNVTPADADMSKYNYAGKDRSTFYQITRANKAGTKWFDELSQNAPTQSYQISATGGSENATYAMSGGYLGQKGSLIHTGFERYNIRTNTQFKAFDGKLRVGENLQYSYTEGFGMGVNPNTAGGYQGEGSVLGFAYRIQNIIPVYDEGGHFAGSYGGWGNGENPVALAFRAKDNKNRSNFFFGNAFAEYDIISGLTLRTNFGMRYENYNGLSLSYPNPEFSEGSFNNGMSEYQGYSTEWTWTNTLTYNPYLGEDNKLTILAGTEAIKSRGRNLSGNRNSYFTLSSLDYFYLNAGTSNIGNASSGSVGSLFSLFAKADYSFMDRYLLSVTVRRDGSSNFGANNLYGTFPGVSGAWRISQEDFMQDTDWLTDLKVRAGYGITGNQRIPGYQYLNRFASSLTQSSYPIGGTTQSGIWQSSYANEDVKWEQVKSLNLGLDFTILNGDIDGSFDWYNKTTDDMLYRLPLPAIAVGRAESPYVNIGSMNNKGVEFSLGYHYGHRQGTPFTLDLSANISRNRNEIVALAPSVDQQIFGSFRSMETSILRVGEPYAAFFGYRTTGIYQDANDIANNPSYPQARPGGLKYADINNDGIIDAEDRTIIGSPHPDFVYSFNLNTTYKNFDFMMYFYGSQGNDLYEATRYFTDFGVFKGQKSTRLLDAWSPTNTGSTIPSLTNDASGYEYASSSYYVQDGSFLKLKNLQLGYNIPTQKLFNENTSFHKLRVYLGVTNVFTITKYKGLDPEISATSSDYPALGVDFGIYPQARQYILGISLGF